MAFINREAFLRNAAKANDAAKVNVKIEGQDLSKARKVNYPQNNVPCSEEITYRNNRDKKRWQNEGFDWL